MFVEYIGQQTDRTRKATDFDSDIEAREWAAQFVAESYRDQAQATVYNDRGEFVVAFHNRGGRVVSIEV